MPRPIAETHNKTAAVRIVDGIIGDRRPPLDSVDRSVLRDRDFAHWGHCRSATFESRPEKLLNRFHVTGFNMKNIVCCALAPYRPISFRPGNVGVERNPTRLHRGDTFLLCEPG